MDDFRECWQTMPDEDLRTIYRDKLSEYKRLGTMAFIPLFPALIVYGIMGWLALFAGRIGPYAGVMHVDTGRVFYYVALAMSSVLLRTVDLKRRWLIFIPPAVTIPVVAVLFMTFSIEAVAVILYLVYAYRRMGELLPDLEFLRGLPRFPFYYRITAKDLRIMNAKDAADYMNISSGNVVAVDREGILTAEHPEEEALPSEKTEEYLQQHKIIYKNEQKEDQT